MQRLDQIIRRAGALAFITIVMSGCSAMDGVNIGANVPLGGIVNVGASTTIDSDRASKPAKKPSKPEPEESEDDAESDAEQ